MSYSSVSEIYDEIEATRARLLRAVEGLGEEQLGFRPAPDAWSIAQLCDHLSLVEASIVRLVGRILSKAEEAGPAREPGLPFEPVNMDGFVERTSAVKLKAPDSARPADARPLAESLAALRDTRAALQSLRPRVERVDGHAAIFPHPASGPLNLYQWLLFVGVHEERHIAQIEALKEKMNAGR